MSENTLKLIADSEARWIDQVSQIREGKSSTSRFRPQRQTVSFLLKAPCSTGLRLLAGKESTNRT